jgi:protein phosphatase
MTPLQTGLTVLLCALVAYWFGRFRVVRSIPGPGVQPALPKARDRRTTPIEPLARVEYEEDDELDPTLVGVPRAPALYQPPVERVVYDDDADEEGPTLSEPMFLVYASARTDTGRRRRQNEDSLTVSESADLFVVADGMGGYRGGATASQIAVTTIASAFARGSFDGPPHAKLPRRASELARAIQMANAAILAAASDAPELKGMGTTICAARFSPNKARMYVGHVGDSRCYRLREGVFGGMTADHTMADFGVKGPGAMDLSRAVGIWPTVPIDIVFATPTPGDVYLLCTDGLTKMVPETSIAEVLQREGNLDRAAAELVSRANEAGGKDNITVVLIRVVSARDKGHASGKGSIGQPT